MARDGAAIKFNADNLARQALCLLLGQGFATHKFGFVQLHEDTEASLKGRDVVAQFIAIEGQAHLKAQGISASEAAGFHLARSHQGLPSANDIGMGAIHLEAVLARIARAADDEGLAVFLQRGKVVELHVLQLHAQHLAAHLFGLRALNGQLSVVLALILGLYVESLGLAFYPGIVLVDVGGIDNEEELRLAHFIDEEVINSSAVFVEHHAVEYFAHGRTAHVVGEDVLHEAFGLGTRHKDFAHVAHVENTASLAHSIVFVCNIGILKRHLKTAKRHHLGAQLYMFLVETGSLV